MEVDQSSLLECLNRKFRCSLCTEILRREENGKSNSFSTEITKECPEEIFSNNKELLLLSSLWGCLTDPDSSKQHSFRDDNGPENSIHFCSNCENYLVEFEQLTQQITSAQRRLSTVKYVVIAKFLSASEVQDGVDNAAAADTGLLINNPKFRAIREKLKKDLIPNVILQRASPSQPRIPPPAFETHATNFDVISTGYESDRDYCPSEISLDPHEEPTSNNRRDEDSSLSQAESEPAVGQKPTVTPRKMYKCVRLGCGQYLYGDKYKFSFKDCRFHCSECPVRLIGKKCIINHIRQVHMSLKGIGVKKKKKGGKPRRLYEFKEVSPNEFIYAEQYKISFDGLRYYCQECFAHYSKIERMLQHVRNVHIRNTAGSKPLGKARNNRLIPVENNPTLFRYRFKYDVSFIPDTGTYQCQVCSEERASPTEMMDHIENIHFKPENSTSTASVLSNTVAPNEFLYNEKYPINFDPTEQVYLCGLCEFRNDHIRHIYPHIRAKHYTDEDKQQFSAVEVTENEYLYGGKYRIFFHGGKYTCGLCSHTRFDLSDLYGHIRSRHLNDDPAEQPTTLAENALSPPEDRINPEATVKTDFLHHRIPYSYEPSSRKYICSVCSISVGLRSSIMAHIKNIHIAQPDQFVCEICGESFRTKRYLNNHRSNHGGQKFNCPHCPKVYRDAKNLKAHVAIHELGDEAKRFQCEYCGKKFHKKTFLDVHVRIHTGEKPVKCDLCPEMFADSAKRYYHRKTVHGVAPKKVYLD